METKDGKTVEYYLNENKIVVPYYWKHDYKGTVDEQNNSYNQETIDIINEYKE